MKDASKNSGLYLLIVHRNIWETTGLRKRIGYGYGGCGFLNEIFSTYNWEVLLL